MTITVSKTFASEAEAIAWLNSGTTTSDAAETTSKAKAETTSKAKAETTSKAKAETKKPSVTQAQMQAALQEVKEKFGVPEAKAIINDAGGVKKMDEIAEDKYEAVFKACQDKLNEETDEGSDDDGI